LLVCTCLQMIHKTFNLNPFIFNCGCYLMYLWFCDKGTSDKFFYSHGPNFKIVVTDPNLLSGKSYALNVKLLNMKIIALVIIWSNVLGRDFSIFQIILLKFAMESFFNVPWTFEARCNEIMGAQVNSNY